MIEGEEYDLARTIDEAISVIVFGSMPRKAPVAPGIRINYAILSCHHMKIR